MRRLTHNPDGFSSVDESPDGELVRYEEHAAERVALVAQLEAARGLLYRLGVWADGYGSALVPHGGAADSFGDGVRYCKRQVKEMLASKMPGTRAQLHAEQRAEAAEAQVAELTRERDDLLTALETFEAETARLTEALAAAERDCVTNAETADEYLREFKAAEARVRELEAKYEEAMRLVTALRESSEQARQMSVSARMALAEDKALESRIEALEVLLAASEARAEQWKADTESYRADATVAKDRLAALKAKVERALQRAAADGFLVESELEDLRG